MTLSEWFKTNIITKDKLPDIRWIITDKDPSNKYIYSFRIDENYHCKSVGTIHTLLEMHTLMYKSLCMISPHIGFYPDFPDYVIGQEPPPVVISTLKLPHHRNDLLTESLAKDRYLAYKTIDKIPVPTITWGVVRSEPGTVGGPPFSGTREMKARERESMAIFSSDIKKHLSHLDLDTVETYGKLVKHIKIKGQVFDNLVQYNIWANSCWEVEELTEWFQDYMTNYTGMFREAGIVQMLFDRRVRDDTLQIIKNDYHLRSLLYYIRTERISIDSVLPINRVDLNAFVINKQIDLNNVDPDEIVDDNIHDKIVDKWTKKFDFGQINNI